MKRKCFLSFFALTICTLGFSADERALFDAVKTKNLAKVNQYIYANANQRFEYGGKAMTAFQLAVENGSTQIAKSLIVDGNADVNADNGDEPPLFIAARNNDLEMFELLINSNANLNKTYEEQPITLYIVMQVNGHYTPFTATIIRRFGNKLTWNWQDNNKRTILHYAVAGGDFETMKATISTDLIAELLSSGLCSLSVADVNGWTPLHIAAQNGNKQLMYILLRSKDANQLLNVKDNEGYTPITRYIKNAYSENRLDIGVILLAMGKCNFTLDDFNFPTEAMSNNGIFLIAENKDTSRVINFFRELSKNNRMLATLEDKDGIPLLCHAIENEWAPEIVDIVMQNYRGDWKKIRIKGRNGKNAIDIMRQNHSEDLYQDIFDKYSY